MFEVLLPSEECPILRGPKEIDPKRPFESIPPGHPRLRQALLDDLKAMVARAFAPVTGFVFKSRRSIESKQQQLANDVISVV
ncbi:hypothetical protein SAMN05444161_9180 [Rhizobiales bacterium GAS191]|nr:hypothetical protein SAMN05444161_9180 [Rhizobiales bacterium GAS191]